MVNGNGNATNPGKRNARTGPRDSAYVARTPVTTFGVLTVWDGPEAREAAARIDGGGLALIAEIEG